LAAASALAPKAGCDFLHIGPSASQERKCLRLRIVHGRTAVEQRHLPEKQSSIEIVATNVAKIVVCRLGIIVVVEYLRDATDCVGLFAERELLSKFSGKYDRQQFTVVELVLVAHFATPITIDPTGIDISAKSGSH
jgi:hypothetical protein